MYWCLRERAWLRAVPYCDFRAPRNVTLRRMPYSLVVVYLCLEHKCVDRHHLVQSELPAPTPLNFLLLSFAALKLGAKLFLCSHYLELLLVAMRSSKKVANYIFCRRVCARTQLRYSTPEMRVKMSQFLG